MDKHAIQIVGAGSGAVDLITVRGMRLLQAADVIVYAGSLVNPQMLEYACKTCKLYNSAEMTLEDVLEVMVEAYNIGKKVVRLHTGDPCIYGAIREQMDMLKNLGILFDVVPGVSSFCGAAAALKAEYTLPGVSQSVIITRAAGRTPVPEGESLKDLASHKSTMVIFLSTGLIEQVQADLIEGGIAPETRAAIVYKATWPDEKTFACTVATLTKTAISNNVTKTALIIVGNVLGNEYERSKLYDPTFTTEFRKGTDGK